MSSIIGAFYYLTVVFGHYINHVQCAYPLDVELENLHKQVETMKQELSVITQQYNEVKSMVASLGLDHKQFSKSKRMSNSKSKDMINDSSSSTRYRRRKETEKALKFIHGGEVIY